MSIPGRPPMSEELRAELAGEIGRILASAARNLHRIYDGDAEEVALRLSEILAAATDQAEEPLVIKVQSLGATELISLREYIDSYVQDWEIGLDEARAVLAEAPRALVYNQEEAIRHPECLQLHRALDPDLLDAEIGRLEEEPPGGALG